MDIAGATSATYAVTSADAGFTLRVDVRARSAISNQTVELCLPR